MPIGASRTQHANTAIPTSSAATAASHQQTNSHARYHSRVHHWTIFIDKYEILSQSISKQFTLLSCMKDYNSQRKLLSEVENDIFECKQSIEDIEREIDGLPYNLRSQASQTIDTYKEELEGYYTLLLAYQSAHQRGQTYFPPMNQPTNPMLDHNIYISPDHDELNHSTDQSSDQDDSPFTEDDDDESHQLINQSNNPKSVRDQILNQSVNLHNSAASNSLDRSSRSLIESIELGEMSNSQLNNQREVLMKQRSHLLSSQESLNQSMRTIGRVQWRAWCDHMLSWFVVLVQIILFVIVAYLKYFAID